MKNKVLIVLAVSFIFLTSLYGQQNQALSMADSLVQQSEHKAAIEVLNKAINDHPSRFVLSKAYYQLSYIYLQMFNFEKAAHYNQLSLNLRKQLRYEFIAGNYMRFGTIELMQNNFEKALDYFLEAAELPHETIQFSGILDAYIATAFSGLKNSEKALQYYQRSLEVLSSEIGDIHPDVATTYYNLGNLYWSTGDAAKAEKTYLKALELEKKINSSGGNIRLSKVNNALGLLYYAVFENYQLADEYFRAGLKDAKGKSIRYEAFSMINLASLALVTDDHLQAESWLNKAMRLLSPDDEQDPEYFIPMILDKSLYSRALSIENQLITAKSKGNFTEKDLRNLLANSELAVEVLESAAFDKYDENQQIAYLETNHDVYENVIVYALQLFDSTNDRAYQIKAFEYAERGKALVLKRMMCDFSAQVESHIDEELLHEEKRILQMLTYFETNLAQKYENESFKKELLQLRNAHQQLIQKIEKDYPDYYRLKHRIPEPSLEQLQSRLDNETALVSYYMGEEDYYIFVVTSTFLKAYQVSPETSLEEGSAKKSRNSVLGNILKKQKIEIPEPGVYTQYTDQGSSLSLVDATNLTIRNLRKAKAKEFANYSYQLYLRLIKPVRSDIRKKKQLIIIPHRELHYLPFEALVSKAPRADKLNFKKLNYLVKKHAISYHLSANLFCEKVKREKTENPENNFLGFAPVFSPEEDSGYVWKSHDYVFDTTYHAANDWRILTKDREMFKKLEHSESEILTIAELFAQKGVRGKAYLHDEATEEHFKTNAGQYKYVHIATHSFANKVNPKLSGIAFAQPTSSEEQEDGILYASETFLLDLSKTELVVLSSCESGFGKLSSEEGLLSLNRGFLYSGVKNTVSSIWKVSDQSTALLMKAFYEQLLDGKTYSNALRLAKLKMIKNKETADPRKWAVFKLTGN